MNKPDHPDLHKLEPLSLDEIDHVAYDVAAGHEPEGYTPAMLRLRERLDPIAAHVDTGAREAWCRLAPESRRASIVALIGAVFGIA